MKYHFGNPHRIDSLADAISRYSIREFKSVTRSTVPMLSLLKHSPDVFNTAVEELGFPEVCELYLEYTVGPFGGRGPASHTDVMLRAGKDALAIEAKWTEPMYPAIKNWPKRGHEKSPNQKAVLEGWLNALSNRLGRNFNVADFDGEIYQMLHRAASAADTGEHPRLAYFLFKPSPEKRAAKPDEILGKLTSLWKLLGKPMNFPFYVVEFNIEPTQIFKDLESLGEKKGKQAIAQAVSEALLDEKPLFKCGVGRLRQVGREAGA